MAANQPRGEQRDVADAAADIEHPHARRNPRPAKELFGQRIQYRGLKKQAAPFPVVMAHHIGGRVRHERSLAYALLVAAWVHPAIAHGRADHVLRVIGRLKDGVTLEQAQTELTAPGTPSSASRKTSNSVASSARRDRALRLPRPALHRTVHDECGGEDQTEAILLHGQCNKSAKPTSS